ALEEDIVADVARLFWREGKLATRRISELAKARRKQICSLKSIVWGNEQTRPKLRDIHEINEIWEKGTPDGLMKELDLVDRLQGMINRCLKQLLMVHGVKSLSSTAASESTPQIARTRKAP